MDRDQWRSKFAMIKYSLKEKKKRMIINIIILITFFDKISKGLFERKCREKFEPLTSGHHIWP